MQLMFDLARTGISLLFLIYASWSDYKTREVSNTVWMVFAPLAFTLTFIQILIYDFSQLPFYGISFGLTTAFSLVIFYSGGFGGADAKALMSLALALPFYPQSLLRIPIGLPTGGVSLISHNIFPITVFSNSVLLAAATAIYMLARNLFWSMNKSNQLFQGELGKEPVSKKIMVLLTGYRIPIAKLREKWHLYPLEDINDDDNPKRKIILLPKDEGREAIVERLSKAVEKERIQNSIWATPGLPMLIFITVGFIVALLFGDIVWIGVSYLLR